MARLSVANRRLASVIIDGQPAYNLGSDYAFTVTFPDNGSVIAVGTNGVMTKVNSDTTATIDVGLLPNSMMNDKLFELFYNQSRGNAKLVDCVFISDVGETFECSQCSIANPSAVVAGGENIDQRTWRLNSQDCRSNVENYGQTSTTNSA